MSVTPPVPAPQPATGGGLTFTSKSFTPSATGPLNFDTSKPLTLRVHTIFDLTGQAEVVGGTDADAQEWDAGCLQTVLASRTAGRYMKEDGTCLRKLVFSIPAAARDGTAGLTPWYSTPDVKPFATTGSVQDTNMADNPGATFVSSFRDPEIGMNKRVLLDRTAGKDRFASWQIVRNRTSGDIRYLKWTTWEVDWAAALDPATGQWNGTGTGSRIIDQGDGIGAETPILIDPVAKDTMTQSQGPC